MEETAISGEHIELRGSGNYEIYLDTTLIGHLEIGNDCTLHDIGIEPQYRGEGYGREAIELFIELAKKANCDTIKTTVVLHGAVKHVLLDNGFEFCEETRHYHKDL